MSPYGFSLLLQTHSMILEGSLTALCVHLFVHNKLPEKAAVVGLVSLVLLEVVLGVLCPCRGPTSEGSVARGGPGQAVPVRLSSTVPVLRQRGWVRCHCCP